VSDEQALRIAIVAVALAATPYVVSLIKQWVKRWREKSRR
jgi:hypothetical protein